MSDTTQFRSIPTVQGLDAVVRRIAARLVNLEGELSAAPDTQLGKIWESIEELNLRVLFLMHTLQIKQTLSPIADPATGKVPTRSMPAIEAYMVHGGREKLIAQLEAQAKAAEHAAAAADAFQGGSPDGEGLQTAEQAAAAPADAGKDTDADNGPSTYVDNPSKFPKQ